MHTSMYRTWAEWRNAIQLQYSVSFNWNLHLSCSNAIGAVVLGLMLGLTPDNPASAQVLNQRVVQLLGNNCSGLGAPGGDPSFGANLMRSVSFPPRMLWGQQGVVERHRCKVRQSQSSIELYCHVLRRDAPRKARKVPGLPR